MLSEKEKMLAGQLYDAGDSELVAMRLHAHTLVNKFHFLITKTTVTSEKRLLKICSVLLEKIS